MDPQKTTIICAIISAFVAVSVAWVTSGQSFKAELEKSKDEVVKIKEELKTYASTASALTAELSEAKKTVAELTGKVAAAGAQATGIQTKIDVVASQMPKTFRPALGNCKPSSDTSPDPREPKVCGPSYFMTGINHDGLIVCCTIEPIR